MLKHAALILLLSAAHANAASCSQEIGRGVASWYGPGFEGARTKNEERFDPSILSAAHPSLPFGTLLKIVNMRNQKNVVVRVNDRGAFAKDRVVDVSEAAGQALGMIADGTAAVAMFRCD